LPFRGAITGDAAGTGALLFFARERRGFDFVVAFSSVTVARKSARSDILSPSFSNKGAASFPSFFQLTPTATPAPKAINPVRTTSRLGMK
jgi:hypothetical protein